jgi:hypothetical protein
MAKLDDFMRGKQVDIALYERDILQLQDGLQILADSWDVVAVNHEVDVIYPKNTFNN